MMRRGETKMRAKEEEKEKGAHGASLVSMILLLDFESDTSCDNYV